MAFELEQEYLAEANAQFVSYTDAEGVLEAELVRYWPKEIHHPATLENALTFLNSFGSVWGYGEDGTNGRTYVTSPYAGVEQYPGDWRIVETRKASTDNDFPSDTNLPGIVQILRRGFIRTIDFGTPVNGLVTEHAFTEARAINRKVSWATPYNSFTLMSSLESGSYCLYY